MADGLCFTTTLPLTRVRAYAREEDSALLIHVGSSQVRQLRRRDRDEHDLRTPWENRLGRRRIVMKMSRENENVLTSSDYTCVNYERRRRRSRVRRNGPHPGGRAARDRNVIQDLKS